MVRDDSGGVLPGASVIVTNVDTGVSRGLLTDAGGWYRAAALPPGRYEVRVELNGFLRQVRSGLTLTIGQEAEVPITLKMAQLEEAVTVTGAAPLVETSKSALGTTVTREQLDSLPLPGRNFSALANLTPGVTGVGGGGLNTSGQLSRNNTFLIDGVSNDEGAVAGTRGGFSLEAVREYAVMANQFPAEYGRASGAMITIVTRSGTNRLEGRGFLLHRGDSFDAQNPFSKAQGSGKAPFSEQRYGGLLGGPLPRDQTHYFGSYEGRRLRETNVITSSLVPVSEREHPQNTNGNQVFGKVDHVFTPAQTLSVRYRIDRTTQTGLGIGGLNTVERGRDFTNTISRWRPTRLASRSSTPAIPIRTAGARCSRSSGARRSHHPTSRRPTRIR
jgi:Carboxypeptidase regulatory-like domain